MSKSNWFSVHQHSNFSTLDGMSRVSDLVERAHQYGQPAMALTDHGVMSGSVQLYQECKKKGMLAFPGQELYVLDPTLDASSNLEDCSKAQRYHLGMVALDIKGYKGMVKLSTLGYTRPRFSRFPRLLLDDLIEFGQEYGDNIAITTGCVFGLLEKTLIDSGVDAARGILRTLQTITPNLYVEIQKHDISDEHAEYPEEQLLDEVISLADDFELPIIATTDSHYLDQSQKSAHSLMKRLIFGGEDDEFPGDTFHFASAGWMKEKFSTDIWDRVEASCTDLLSKHKLVIPELDTFKPHIPQMATNPDKALKDKCYKGLFDYLGDDPADEYIERLEEELRVIKVIGMSNYFLLVLNSVDYMRQQQIPVESRGSANGSMVCFLLGITQIDPIQWGTNFSRFLSEDRVGQAPDIDLDVSDKDRWVILDYLSKLKINGVKYKTSQIGTMSKLGQSDNDENDTGSAFNTYKSFIRRTYTEKAWEHEKALAEAEGRKAVKARAEEKGAIEYNMSDDVTVKALEDVKYVRPNDYDGLKQIIQMNSVYKSKGTHAGGILISGEDAKIEEYVPQMLIPKASGEGDTIVTQFTMKDVEQFGFLKMDWLGQTSLAVMQKCMDFLGKENLLDFSWIPFDDAQTLRYVNSRKNHPGLFHLENYPKSVAMAELKPKSTQDFVLWQAYSMPGAVDSGAAKIYLERRNNKTKDFGYTHPILKATFDQTMGVMIYQEQVLEYCRAIGMVGSELTSFFKIIKDSGAGAVERNKQRLADAKPRFTQLSLDSGITAEDTEWVWKQMVAMGGYAFSINHSAGYGIRSYRTAYLKCNHPVEYMAALLYCWAGSNTQVKQFGKKVRKEEVYLKEAEKMKIDILEPIINKAKANWDIAFESKALRKGYASIKGVGAKAAETIAAGQPYADMDDFANRANISGAAAYRKDKSWKGIFQTMNNLGLLEGIK